MTVEKLILKHFSEIPSEYEDLEFLMIEFAKYHVQEALKAASGIADDWKNSGELAPEILNSYPLENIK